MENKALLTTSIYRPEQLHGCIQLCAEENLPVRVCLFLSLYLLLEFKLNMKYVPDTFNYTNM